MRYPRSLWRCLGQKKADGIAVDEDGDVDSAASYVGTASGGKVSLKGG